MKQKYLFLLFFSILSISVFAQSSGKWNLVWREDFGVAEDTVIKDYPDNTMTVPNHCFMENTRYCESGVYWNGSANVCDTYGCQSGTDECGTIDDGYYGITNSTWWAYNRWKSCNKTAGHFVGGRDHTGNDKGAMLVINSGVGEGDPIFTKEINFHLCDSRTYKFVIYAASITAYQNDGGNANLELNVVDTKTNTVRATIKTGDIPWWFQRSTWTSYSDDSTASNPYANKNWSEYSCTFTANDGDVLELQVTNWGSGYNDFAIDDISLYRNDDVEVKIPEISTNTVSLESTSNNGTCVYNAMFAISSDVTDSWKSIYNYVYFLWQSSTDDGYTWTNETGVSGIDKSSVTIEVDATKTTVYRVIITGSSDAAKAKSNAEYIALNGGPEDGCSFYSISNTMAGVSPTTDCTLKDGLKEVWREDFGYIDSTETHSFSAIGSTLNYFSPTTEGGMENNLPSYAVTCAPDSSIQRANQWSSYEKSLKEYYTPVANDAVLYVHVPKSESVTIVDKVLNGVFCNCKSYIFSCKTMTLSSWTTMNFELDIVDKNGSVIASDPITINGGSPTWNIMSISFSLPFDYTGDVHCQVKYLGNQNWSVPVIFDDFAVSVCQEKAPQAEVVLDNTSSHYISGFDCSSTPVHIANLINLDDWTSQYPNFGYVWQSSRDGVTWTTISETNKNHYCEDLEDGETLFRVVIGETKDVATQVANNGKPTSPCATYYITNSVGLYCKGVKCEEPADITITSSDADNVLCPGETATLTPTAQTSTTQFAQEWYKDDVLEAGYPKTTDQAVYSATAAGTYKIKVYDAENPTMQKCWKTAEITIEEKENPTVTISGGAEYCKGKTVDAATFTFTGTQPFEFTYTDGTTTSTKTATTTTFSPTVPTSIGEYTYKVSALQDKYCSAVAAGMTSSTTITIKEQPSVTVENDGPVCAGTAVNLTATCATAGVTYTWSGPNSYTSTVAAPVLSSTTTSMSGNYTVKVALNGCEASATTSVKINAVPEIKTITTDKTSICPDETATITATVSDAGTGTFTWTNATGTKLTATVSNDVTAQETKTVTLAYTSADGCDATSKTTTVTLNPKPSAPTVTDLSFCIGDANQTLTATAVTGATLNWYGTSATGGTAGTAPTTNTATAATTNYYVSQTLNGCESDRAALAVVVNSSLTPTITIDDAELCPTEATKISLPQASSYTSIVWSGTATANLNNVSLAAPTFTAGTESAVKSYTISVNVEDAKGCKGTASETIVVNPTPTVTIAPASAELCKLETTTITATPSEVGGTGVWTGATKDSETTATFTASTEGNQTISYVYTSAKGCESESATTSVLVNAIPSAPTTTDVSYCKNAITATALTANATGTLTWFDANDKQLTSSPIPTTTKAGTTTYSVLQTENGCASEKANLSVTIHDLPTPTITLSKSAECEGQPISVGLSETYKSQTWTCTPTNFLSSTSIASPVFLATATSGDYTIGVEVTDANGCSASTSSNVTIHPIPSASLSSVEPKCASVEDAQTITATITPTVEGTGLWTIATKATETTATVKPNSLGAGNHTITYNFTSNAGCKATEVSTNALVYEMPTITLKASNSASCKGGANSDEVTMITTGTATTGTFAYSSATLTTINVTTGAFDPASESVGKHSVTLTYTDENSCQATATTEVEVLARPVADVSTNPTAICDYSADKTLVATIDGVTNTNGTWSGIGVSGATFSPATATAGGPYTITYNYTDATTKCSAEAVSFQITVNHTDAPSVVSKSESKLNVSKQADVPELEATGDNITWYASNDTTTTPIASTANYQQTYVDEDGHMKVGTYSAYATQTKNGCQSVPAEATLTITDCSVSAPTAVKYHACEGDASIDISATSTHTSATNIGWFDDRNSIPTGTVASLASGNPKGTGDTYTYSLAGKTAGTYTMYASEYDGTAGTECFSPATAVVIEVHALPNPQIDDPGIICGGDADKEITYSPGTGSTLSGTGVTGSLWTPQYDATTTGTTTTTLTLTSVATWGTGTDVTATCENTVTRDITVTNVLAPTGTGIGTTQMWSIGSIASLPAMEISYASALGATLSVKNEANEEIATASPVEMYPTNIDKLGIYTYSLIQTLNGCTSPVAKSVYQIVECPTPTPAPESKQICVGDVLPTIEANGTGTPSYEWVDSSNTVISTDATLNIASLSGYTNAGVYTFKVRQDGLDAAGNTCWGAYGMATLTIHSLPNVEITNPGTLCYATGSYMIEAKANGVNSTSLTSGTWTISDGTISSSGEINTTENGKKDGVYTVTYSYTDNNGCVNSASQDITIEYPEEPTTIAFTGIISHPVEVEVTANNLETSASVQWYDEDKSTALATDNPWKPGIDGTAEVSKTYWVSQIVNGCESEKVAQSIEIVDCPWGAPSVTNAEVCMNETAPEMSAAAPAGASPIEWKWYDASKNTLSNNATTYAQTTTSSVGTTSYYVSYTAMESVSGEACESAPALVTTTVFNLPQITFEESSSVACYTSDAEEIIVSVDYGTNGKGTGVWSISGDADAISQSGIFSPKKNGEVSGTYTITYTYTDAKSCVNSADRTIDVIYLAAPVTTNHFTMTTQNIDAVVSAELNGGTSIHWYDTMTGGSEKGTGTSWTTGDKGNVVLDSKNYYAAQEKSGCYSERAAANVKIIECPIPNVEITDATACVYDGAPTLVASEGTWSASRPMGSVFRFYDNATGGTIVAESADGSFTPSVTTAGEYNYWVSEYNANIDPVGCEGPRKQVTVTMKEVKVPSVSAKDGISAVCSGSQNPTFVANATSGTTYWYEENPGSEGVPQTSEVSNGSSFKPSITTDGEHTIWAVQYDNDCYSNRAELNYTIKPIPAAPTTTGNEICYAEAGKSITATGETGAIIVWYSTKSATNELLRGSNGYQSKETSVGTYTYYATQFINDCESPVAEAVYKIKALPSAPTIISQANVCEYDAAPTLKAVGENIVWYASDKQTQVATGDSYQTDDMSIATNRFYVTQTVDGCEGPQALLSYVVNAKPAEPIVKGASMCAGDTVVPSLETNIAIDNWYADASATTYLATGHTYSPELSSIIGTMTYYVQREQSGCVSDVVPAVLNVIAQPTFTIGDDITLCVYDSVAVIQARDFSPEITDNSYIGWTVTAGRKSSAYVDNSEHNIQPVDMVSEVGTYTISAYYRYKYDNVSCNSETQTISYTVKKRARTPIVFSTVICQGEEITDLRALGSTNMTWKSLSGTAPAYATGSRYKFENKDLAIGEYQFEVYDMDVYDAENNLGCESLHDTVTMTVAPAAKTKLFGADSVCVGNTESYFTQYTDNSTYFWNVSGGNLNYAKDQSTSVRYVDWLKAGVDTVTVYEQTWAGCEGFDTLVVKIAANPVAQFNWSLPGSTNIIELVDSSLQDTLWYVNENGEPVGEAIPYTMSWNYGHQGENETIVDKEVPYEQRHVSFTEGDYTYGYNCPILTVTNSFGCKDVVTECVFVNITTSLYVPNAFSPTNPAHSVRNFQPQGFNLKTCEISVYDKWGNMVWFSNEVENGMFVGKWDGTYEGKMMKSDVYIWKMEATFLDGQVWEGFDDGNGKKCKFGSVTLIR